MPLPTPEPGLVISYAYLWRHEKNRGQEEGVKQRPCAVIIATRTAGGDDGIVVIVAPITHRAPNDPSRAVEIPPSTKRRLGLDETRSWVVVDEVNRFIWPGPDLRPVSRDRPATFAYGVLPPVLFRTIRDRIVTLARTDRLKVTQRNV